MKVIVHLTISDDDRAKMAQSLGHSGLVTRNQVTEAVNIFITERINGTGTESPTNADTVHTEAGPERSERDHSDARNALVRAEERAVDRRAGKFVPSRGDEPYLYRAQDPRLAAACSAVLDATGRLDEYIWEKLEENRE